MDDLESQDGLDGQKPESDANSLEGSSAVADSEVHNTEEGEGATVAVSPDVGEEPAVEEVPENANPNLKWYVVQAYSGFELKVRDALEERVRHAGLESKFGKVHVPQEKVVEIVRGEKKTTNRKFFPGYILVQMELDEETWHLVKETPKVSGFVGDRTDPQPVPEEEVRKVLDQMEEGALSPKARMNFNPGDVVKVVHGALNGLSGTVEEVRPKTGTIKVMFSIFGRSTPVELEYVQVEKV